MKVRAAAESDIAALAANDELNQASSALTCAYVAVAQLVDELVDEGASSEDLVRATRELGRLRVQLAPARASGDVDAVDVFDALVAQLGQA